MHARHGHPADVAGWIKRLRATKNDEREQYFDFDEQMKEELARWDRASLFERQRGADVRIDAADDLTVEIMYDVSWCYVDLHVTEPSGETVTWNHTDSQAGARFTGGYNWGYGPEIYAIRTAPKGDYKIAIDYWSTDETTVSLETIVHVIVHARGRRGKIERRDFFGVLGVEDEHVTLTTIRMD